VAGAWQARCRWWSHDDQQHFLGSARSSGRRVSEDRRPPRFRASIGQWRTGRRLPAGCERGRSGLLPCPARGFAHSLGGAYAHRFAQLYPQEVAGLVWLDAFHRDWDDFVPAVASLAASEQMAPDLEQIQQMRPALREMCVELLMDYPEHVRQALTDAHVSDEWLQVGFAERGSLVVLADELRAGLNIPDVPVVALTPLGIDPAQQALMSEQTLREMHEGKRRMDAALVSAVSHGEQRIIADVGHSQLCFERPDVVVQAIRDVVDWTARA
jgi:pimeloyl-ACP methyl ester carboxylesterase